ncbi:MAG: hypothetical protein M1821_008270 [Bathelium mastoideum]|nr:MAG: hypothetical protein M1821_008270 [Bathelium mastoideum]
MSFFTSFITDKKKQVVLFSSTAIALYGYDQGMMSLINTNKDYLSTMGISEDDPLVGVIVSVYYLGCAVGAVLFSSFADRYGRKKGILACLATAALGNVIMFISGLGYDQAAIVVMFIGRIVMGLGVGGVDSVVPVYSSELSSDDSRGKALAQEFQMNIFGLNMAFAINLGVTVSLGKWNQWAWRIPIICMQVFPFAMFAVIEKLPESPRWLVYNDKPEEALKSLEALFGEEESKERVEQLKEAHKSESGQSVSYWDMLTPGHTQWHATVVTIMGRPLEDVRPFLTLIDYGAGQINQALTGYGAVSVYGPQIAELLGFGVRESEYLTMGNYISYFILMTFAWLLIDALGRRKLLVGGSLWLGVCFGLMTVFGGLAMNATELQIPIKAVAIPGMVVLYIATGAFGVGWLATVWLIPTEIFPTTARAQGTAISVIIWGLANFAVTLLTPIMFNNLEYWIFLIFCATNAFAGIWTYVYLPESGNRSFEENQQFFKDAKEAGTWRVSKVKGGEYKRLPYPTSGEGDNAEREPLLNRVRDQLG